MLLPRILILPDLKRAALTLWHPFHRIGPVDFGSHPAAPRKRLQVSRVASLFRGAGAPRSGLRGVRGAPLQPDAGIPHQPVPLGASETEIEVPTRPRSAGLRLLQLENEAPLPRTSRGIWNMLQGPAPRLARRGAAGAIGAEGHQPHLAHVGAGGAVLDTEPTGLLKAVGHGGAARSAAARAVDLVAGHPSCLWRGALGRGGLRWVLAASPRLWARIAVQTLGRPAAVGGPVGRLALQRDLHGRAPRGARVRGAQELGDEHGRAALERAHASPQAAAILRAARGKGVRAAPPRQGVECHEKVVFSLLV